MIRIEATSREPLKHFQAAVMLSEGEETIHKVLQWEREAYRPVVMGQ